jgi:hypothetical protein
MSEQKFRISGAIFPVEEESNSKDTQDVFRYAVFVANQNKIGPFQDYANDYPQLDYKIITYSDASNTLTAAQKSTSLKGLIKQ